MMFPHSYSLFFYLIYVSSNFIFFSDYLSSSLPFSIPHYLFPSLIPIISNPIIFSSSLLFQLSFLISHLSSSLITLRPLVCKGNARGDTRIMAFCIIYCLFIDLLRFRSFFMDFNRIFLDLSLILSQSLFLNF